MIVIGLGSNLGDRSHNIRQALFQLGQGFSDKSVGSTIQVLKVSSFYESDALLPTDAPLSWNQPYLNAAALIKTSLNPLELLGELKRIERTLGRVVKDRWAPRVIDLDILAWDQLVLKSPERSIEIPHPSLLERPFALLPFAEVLPLWTFPVPGENYGVTADQLCRRWKNQPASEIPLNTRSVALSKPRWVGILNVTPDSFSDGGYYEHVDAALIQAQRLIDAGADVLDIGAESTRPHASPISEENEWARLKEILPTIRKTFPQVTISIDTRHARVAQYAIECGVQWINDVSGLQSEAMLALARICDTRFVLVHSLSVPVQPKEIIPLDQDPVECLLAWCHRRVDELQQAGISAQRLILDPGIGFGKNPVQSLSILKNISRFKSIGLPLLVGHSRKSFLTLFSNTRPIERDLETVVSSLYLGQNGVDYLRVHDIQAHERAYQIFQSLHEVS